MDLAQIMRVLPGARLEGSSSARVSGIAYDSRSVAPGDLFVCIRGLAADGHSFAPEAVDRGAEALVVERRLELPVPQVVVDSSRLALLHLSRHLAGNPGRSLFMVGVTGTNGKTTVTYMTRHLLLRRGWGVGLVGTVQNVVGGRRLPVERTTPESRDLYYLLADMVRAGDTAAVLEVSSHALALDRVHAGDLDVGVFTNLTQDHLDFHRDMDDYFEAKATLFSGLGGTGGGPAAVINADDPRGADMATRTGHGVITYGLKGETDLGAEEVDIHAAGARFLLRWQGRRWPVELPLSGDFNVYNALAATGAAICAGMDAGEVADALGSVPPVPGRFERVDRGQDFTVIVDYAHTPDSLENALGTARRLARGRVVVVFGCGGDRDRTKRPLMGALAAELADVAVITSDNPRTEDPGAIIADIRDGFTRGTAGGAAGRYVIEPDRERAIALALAEARPGDLVLIAGKGHETYQVFADRTADFDDRAVAARILERGGGRA